MRSSNRDAIAAVHESGSQPIPDMLARAGNVGSQVNGGHAVVDRDITDLAVDTRSGRS